MRKMRLSQNLVGRRLAQSIQSPRGVTMLTPGVVLQPDSIERLKGYGIAYVFVEDPLFAEVTARCAVNIPLLHQVQDFLSLWWGHPSPKVPHSRVEELTRAVMAEQDGWKADQLHPLAPAFPEQRPACRALNRMTLAMHMAAATLPQQRLELGEASLISDLFSPDAERDPLSGLPPGFLAGDGWSAYVKIALAQRDERYNGTGKKGIEGEKLHPLAQYLAVADRYVRLVEGDEDEPWPPGEAVEYLLSLSGDEFGPMAINAFRKCVFPYPIGSLVRLGGGEKAVVIENRPDLPTRPLIKVIANEAEETLSNPLRLDLAQGHNDRVIVALVDE